MTVKKILIGAAMCGFFGGNAQSNYDKCGENYVKQNVTAATGSYENTRISFFEAIDDFIKNDNQPEAAIYTIPVVVHIIYADNRDNINRDQILDAIRVISRDYRRQNADTTNTRAIFKGVAADTEIEFQLAKLDPQGNCTEGITRTFSTLSANANDNVKSSSVRPPWDNKKYLNIWVVRNIALPGQSNTTLGYAYKPANQSSFSAQDGVVIRHDQMGEIGTASTGGRTLTHEVGHYLGLDHTFQGACGNQGDNCNDTPKAANPNFNCPIGINSCTNESPDLPDQVENYMDYGDDDCLNMFTNNQTSIMRGSLNVPNLRGSLISASNLLTTGIAANQVLPCAPKVDFSSDQQLICEGGNIQFNDLTYMGNPTSYSWTFPGGNPSTSTAKNPLVNYPVKGNYQVELVVTNASGNSDTLKYGYISVRSQTNTPYVNAFGDDFEMYPIPNQNWAVSPGLDTTVFRYFSKVAYVGQSCVTLQNFNALVGEKDEMVSHTISLANSKDAQLTFYYSFAERILGNSDALKIYVSDDCGQNWALKSTRLGPLLRTTSTRIDTSWYPTLGNDWNLGTMSLNDYALSSNPILIKFEFTCGNGNNFYLDEVYVTTTIGTEELFDNKTFSVYPNPAQNQITVELVHPGGTVTLSDLAGRIVKTQKLDSAQKSNVLSLENLSAGVYILKVEQGNNVRSEKIIIQ